MTKSARDLLRTWDTEHVKRQYSALGQTTGSLGNYKISTAYNQMQKELKRRQKRGENVGFFAGCDR